MKLYNPFRRIRDLQAANSRAADTIGNLQIKNRRLKETISSKEGVAQTWFDIATSRAMTINQQDQAIAAFMEDREELKAAAVDAEETGIRLALKLVGTERAVKALTGIVGELLETVEELEDEVEDLEAEAAQDAAHTLEAVSYIKAVEALLTSSGITVQHLDDGSMVVVVAQSAAERAHDAGVIQLAA